MDLDHCVANKYFQHQVIIHENYRYCVLKASDEK